MSTTISIDDVQKVPRREATAHKGDSGRVAIIAGSRGMSGAAVLCGLGALRGGAGLVRVICPAEIQATVAASEPCLMTVPISDDEAGVPGMFDKLQPLLSWASAVAFGPGLGLERLTLNNYSTVMQECEAPLVLDADGLNVLAEIPEWVEAGPTSASRCWWKFREGAPTVITPHPGEMARLRKALRLPERELVKDDERVEVATEYAGLSNSIVVLKGHHTVVTDGSRVYVNQTGNSGMATGGMGDVLTGLIAALIGQGLPPFDAACLGVYVHGKAGDLAAERIGPVGFLAREVADLIPAALAVANLPRIGFHS
ncbi:MAG: NAD(P)H-hydrate dehydratase [Deltaproteobacteria bacterium]|nr:NAD(P)H-hydrate dehydratase [Deltaproteobacteria bacterium]